MTITQGARMITRQMTLFFSTTFWDLSVALFHFWVSRSPFALCSGLYTIRVCLSMKTFKPVNIDIYIIHHIDIYVYIIYTYFIYRRAAGGLWKTLFQFPWTHRFINASSHHAFDWNATLILRSHCFFSAASIRNPFPQKVPRGRNVLS